MSARHRFPARRSRLPAGLLVAGIIVPLALAGSGAPRQAPPVLRLSQLDARRSGVAIEIHHHAQGASDLLEVDLPGGAPPVAGTELSPAEVARRAALALVAAAPNGSIAVADAIDDPASGLTVVSPTGAQVHVGLRGVGGAAFGPDAGWLAVTDASGALWRVQAATGDARLVDPGPYGGSVAIDPRGRVLAVAVSSVEAPYASTLVAVDPDSGRSEAIDVGPVGIVFGARALSDGRLAAVVHPVGGGVELRIIDSAGAVIARELDPGATDVTFSDDASVIGYVVAGDGSYLIANGTRSRIGDGTLPRVAPDGATVALVSAAGTAVLDHRAFVLGTFSSPLAAWITCGAGCAP